MDLLIFFPLQGTRTHAPTYTHVSNQLSNSRGSKISMFHVSVTFVLQQTWVEQMFCFVST